MARGGVLVIVIVIVIVIVGVVGGVAMIGCGSKERGGASAGSASGSAPQAARDAADPALADPTSRAARCAWPCLYVMDTMYYDIPAKVERDCPGKTWAWDSNDCEAARFTYHCAFAAYGREPDDAGMRPQFEALPWYRKRDVALKEIASTAHRARELYFQVVARCERDKIPKVSADDRALAEAWIEKLRLGTTVPGVFEREDLDRFLAEMPDRAFAAKTRVEYVETPTEKRTIEVSNLMWYAGPGEYDREHRVRLTFDDKNQLVGVTF